MCVCLRTNNHTHTNIGTIPVFSVCIRTSVCVLDKHTPQYGGWPPSQENFQIVAINDGVEVCVGVGGVLCAVNVCV